MPSLIIPDPLDMESPRLQLVETATVASCASFTTSDWTGISADHSVKGFATEADRVHVRCLLRGRDVWLSVGQGVGLLVS